MKTKRKVKGTRNPLFLHINNLINRKEFFGVVLLLSSYHHVMDDKLLTLLLFRFYSGVLSYLNMVNCTDDFDEDTIDYQSVMTEIKSLCNVCPSLYYCIEYLFHKYGVVKGGVL